MKTITVLRIAFWANVVVILLAPDFIAIPAVIAQIGLMVTLLYLRRRERRLRRDRALE